MVPTIVKCLEKVQNFEQKLNFHVGLVQPHLEALEHFFYFKMVLLKVTQKLITRLDFRMGLPLDVMTDLDNISPIELLGN